MTEESKGLPGCFKVGCIGCLALVALMVGLLVFGGVIQMVNQNREPDFQQAQHEQQLPKPPVELEQVTIFDPSEDSPELPKVLPLPQSFSLPPGVNPGTIAIDLSAGEFKIRPGEPGEPVRVEADYDAGSFILEEDLVEEDGEWSYKVRFRARGGFFGLIQGKEVDNEITIVIPKGQPIDLVGEVGLGESEIDLGGLWLRQVDLDLGAGEHFIEFSEPTPQPLERFHLESSVGELEVRKLGNASPASVRLEGGIGEIFLDLNGPWRQDADVLTSFRIGEYRLWLPDNAHVELDSAKVAIGERSGSVPERPDLPEDAPTLKVEVSGAIGELRVD